MFYFSASNDNNMNPNYGYNAIFDLNEAPVFTPDDMGNKLKKGTIRLNCTTFDLILYF